MSVQKIDSYLTRQNPNVYGGKQEDYVKRTGEVLQEGLKLTQEAVKEKKDLKQLFFILLDLFAKTRHEIAMDHMDDDEPEDAKLFGRYRMHCTEDVNITPLNGQYSGFNNRMIEIFQMILKGSIPIKKEPTKKKFIVEETCLGRRCSFEVEVLTQKEIVERQWHMKFHSDMVEVKTTFPFDPAIDTIDYKNYPPKKEEQILLNEFNKQLQTIKAKYAAYYIHGKMVYTFERLRDTYPPPKTFFEKGKPVIGEGNPYHLKSIYILGKTRIEIDGKMYALGEVLTWTYKDFDTDPVDKDGTFNRSHSSSRPIPDRSDIERDCSYL